MKKLKLISILFFLTQGARSQLVSFCENLHYAESVISDGRYIYAANLGYKLDAMAKDGDGSIARISLTGKLIDSNFCKGKLNGPKGMAIVNGVLYCADIDRVTGISLASGKIVRSFDFSGFKTLLLNDIASNGKNILFITATDINTVFSLSLTSGEIRVLRQGVMGANGIIYDKELNKLYVVGLGKMGDAIPTGLIGSIDLNPSQPAFTLISNRPGIYDGIVQIKPGTLIVTDWTSFTKPAGKILQLNSTTGEMTTLPIRPIEGPADIWYLPATHTLLIPEMVQQRILSLSIDGR